MSGSVPEVLGATATKLPWPDNYFDAVLTRPAALWERAL